MVKRAGALRLCFLDLLVAPPGGARGAALVTDARTVPVEVRLTDPLMPTPVQRALYGASLDDHALVDLLAVPVLRALREEITIVLVRTARLLRLQERISTPVLWVGRQEDLTPIPDADEPGFLLAARDDRFPSVIGLGYRGHHDETRSACELLQRVLQKSDLLEPFVRLESALGHLTAAVRSGVNSGVTGS